MEDRPIVYILSSWPSAKCLPRFPRCPCYSYRQARRATKSSLEEIASEPRPMSFDQRFPISRSSMITYWKARLGSLGSFHKPGNLIHVFGPLRCEAVRVSNLLRLADLRVFLLPVASSPFTDSLTTFAVFDALTVLVLLLNRSSAKPFFLEDVLTNVASFLVFVPLISTSPVIWSG